jgi:hypothetical protein
MRPNMISKAAPGSKSAIDIVSKSDAEAIIAAIRQRYPTRPNAPSIVGMNFDLINQRHIGKLPRPNEIIPS